MLTRPLQHVSGLIGGVGVYLGTDGALGDSRAAHSDRSDPIPPYKDPFRSMQLKNIPLHPAIAD